MREVYLDHNATSPIRPEAKAAALAALEIGGNPSAQHARGRRARAVIEDARLQVAALVGGSPERLAFTSGGVEANNMVVADAAAAGCTLLVLDVEHSSVRLAAEASGAAVELIPVTADGVADLAWLEQRLADWRDAEGAPFVAMMVANNESGVIQPVAEAAALAHARGGRLHADAVPAAGKIALDLERLGADSLSLAAHKLGGPQGCGALLWRTDASRPTKRLHGGGQERGIRAGTENIAGIAGFGAAAEAAAAELAHGHEAMRTWRDKAQDELRQAVTSLDMTVFGETAPRLPNTLFFAAPGFSAERQVMALDLAGVMVSAGAACASGKAKSSLVAERMGRPDLASCAIRVSGGWNTVEEDWARFVAVWSEAYERFSRNRAEAA